MSTIEPASQVEAPRKSYGWRLKILLGLNFLALGVFIFSRLTPSQVERLGPWGESLHAALNPSEAARKIGPAGRRLVADVKEFGGLAVRQGRSPGFLGILGGTDLFYITINPFGGDEGKAFGDDDLARLLEAHRNSITGLDLRETRVTDAGLRHLEGMPRLDSLVLGNLESSRFPAAQKQSPTSPITDAGLAHLRDLPELMNLHIHCLPITDEGLAKIGDLPKLFGLYLRQTEVQGLGLDRLKPLPGLYSLSIEDGEMSDEALTKLAGAARLQSLGLNGQIQLTVEGLKPLLALPMLGQLRLTGCGFLDEEVAKFQAGKPSLKIER